MVFSYCWAAHILALVMGYTARLIGLELAMLDELADEKEIPVEHRDLGWIGFAAFGKTGRSVVFPCRII